MIVHAGLWRDRVSSSNFRSWRGGFLHPTRQRDPDCRSVSWDHAPAGQAVDFGEPQHPLKLDHNFGRPIMRKKFQMTH